MCGGLQARVREQECSLRRGREAASPQGEIFTYSLGVSAPGSSQPVIRSVQLNLLDSKISTSGEMM